MKKILVLGGTGFVGRHVCEALDRQGLSITVPTRRLPARSVQMLPRVQVVQADVHDDDALNDLVAGHDAVINLVAILHGNAEAFDHVHVRLPARLAAACARAGVRRLVHISALGADLNGPSLYQRSKAQGEQALLSLASAHGLSLTLLRPSVIFGRDDAFINLFARLQAVAPVMPLAGARTRFQPVWVQDVAHAIVHSVQHPHTPEQIYELCGPQVLTLQALVQWAGHWSGHPRPVLALPAPLAYVQAWLMELLPGPTLMSRDNLDSMRVDNVASGHLPGLDALGVARAASIDAVFVITPAA